MLGKLLSRLAKNSTAPRADRARGLHAPFIDDQINLLYNLLYCDDAALFMPPDGKNAASWQSVLFATVPDPRAIGALANNLETESRIRLLAFNWLRLNQQPVGRQQVLGVVVEVPLDVGLDVLAAYADGRVRYINQSGKVAIFDGGVAPVESKAQQLVGLSAPLVAKIGPWREQRLRPPSKGKVRITFLVSDGLYFGEGPFEVMQRDPLAAPIIACATELLRLVADRAA